ncbi:MAG TPA: ABC transporter permease [Gemmatimonadaceae bacterium]
MTGPFEPVRSRPDRWRRYLRFWGANVRADVDDEIAFHLDALIAYYVEHGLAPDDARRLAAEQFGNRYGIARSMRALANQRENAMRRTEWTDGIARDLRFAFRQLRKRPAFTVIALVTLALGIGANTAMFSAVNTVLLHPIDAPALDRIVFVHDNIPSLPLMDTPLDPNETLELATHRELFVAAGGATDAGSAILTGDGEAQRLTASRTVGDFFRVFSQAPLLGRFYRPDESEPGHSLVTVLSFDLWRSLGSDSTIVGKGLLFNGTNFEVVGVAKPGFRYPRDAQLWVPYTLTPDAKINHGRMIMNSVARVHDGITPTQLKAQLDVIQSTKVHPNAKLAEFFMTTRPFVHETAGQLRPTLIVLLGAVGFVLLIACANVASLQLVHGAARAREMAVRVAVGAARGTIIRQLLIENLVLSIGGGALGIGVGAAILKLLAFAGSKNLPALVDVHLDGLVLAFTASTTILAGLAFGVLPALRAGRVDLHDSLKEGTRGASLGAKRNRALQTGVVVQVALSLVLLLSAGLMVRSLRELLAQSPGFKADGVATMRVIASGRQYFPQNERLPVFYGDLVTRLAAAPGMTAVGIVSELPFSDTRNSSPFMVIGRPYDATKPALHANQRSIGGEYFRAMDIPLIRGRVFDNSDVRVAGHPVSAIIDETLAKTFFPNEDPIGKQIDQSGPATIVGIVGTVAQQQLGEPPKATIYFPFNQHPWNTSMFIVARTPLPMTQTLATVRRVVGAMDHNLPVFEPFMLVDRIDTSIAPRRLAMTVLTGLAALALGLAVFGLYGVVSYAVTQRTTEFGIRIALGASSRDVRAMVVRQGATLAIIGVVVGLLASYVATAVLTKLLFGVSAHDPLTFAAAPVVLAIVAVGASYLPARRATKVSPLEALRSS